MFKEVKGPSRRYFYQKQALFEELSCKTAYVHITCFSFFSSKINEQTWFYNLLVSLYLIAEKSIKILFYEIKLEKKNLPIKLPKYLLYYYTSKWGKCNMDVSCFATKLFICRFILLSLFYSTSTVSMVSHLNMLKPRCVPYLVISDNR